MSSIVTDHHNHIFTISILYFKVSEIFSDNKSPLSASISCYKRCFYKMKEVLNEVPVLLSRMKFTSVFCLYFDCLKKIWIFFVLSTLFYIQNERRHYNENKVNRKGSLGHAKRNFWDDNQTRRIWLALENGMVVSTCVWERAAFCRLYLNMNTVLCSIFVYIL